MIYKKAQIVSVIEDHEVKWMIIFRDKKERPKFNSLEEAKNYIDKKMVLN